MQKHLITLGLLLISLGAIAQDDALARLHDGGHILMLRHATHAAPCDCTGVW
jgi:hypothetical protein